MSISITAETPELLQVVVPMCVRLIDTGAGVITAIDLISTTHIVRSIGVLFGIPGVGSQQLSPQRLLLFRSATMTREMITRFITIRGSIM